MNFGEKLQKMRKEKGLSQEALAEMLGISRQSVSKWESGLTLPETNTLITISEIFGVTIDSLLKTGTPQYDEGNTASEAFWRMRGSVYEYKSKRTIGGLPLVHIHVGQGRKKAKGIIAIGNSATGVIAIGVIARGLVSLGVVSIGLIGLGTVSFGLLIAAGAISIGSFALGAFSVGLIALGAFSVGLYAVGAFAAGGIAVGDHAYGQIAIGQVAAGARTFIDQSPLGQRFSMINRGEVRAAIMEEYPWLWKPMVDFILAVIR